jgi:hypothetical protein
MITLRDRPAPLGPGRIPAIHFGGDNDLVAPSEIVDRAAEDLFAIAEGITVRCVEETDPGVERALDESTALLVA